MHSLALQFDNLLQSCARFNSINRCRNGIGKTGAKNARQGRTSFLLSIKTVFCRRGPSDDRRQEKHKEALAEKADQAMTPPLRFSCESLHDTRPGQEAGATAGPSRGRTGKVQRPAGEDRALHHCLRRRRPQAPCARDQRRFVAEFAERAGEGTLVVWFSTGCRGLNFWAGHQREGQGDQAAPGSCSTGALIASHAVPCCKILGRWSLPRTRRSSVSRNPFQRPGFVLCGLAFPFWARSWRARTNISRGSRVKSRRFKSRLRRRYIPGCCKVTFYMFFSLTGKESPQKRRRSHSSQRPRIFFHTALLSDLLRFS